MDRVSDAELVDRARRGDQAAFGELIDRHRAAVHRAALAALGAASEADEVAQEAFVAAYFKLSTFRSESSFKTWLLRIAWRKALTRRRSVRRALGRLTSMTSLDPPTHELSHEDERSAERALIDAELAAHVRRLVGRLPAKLKDTLLLAASGEYTYEEIAAMLAVPAGTVKWRISEGRRRVKRKLAALGYRDD